MTTLEILFASISAVTSIAMVYLSRQNNTLQKIIEAVRLFDEPTAKLMLKRARRHDHNTYTLSQRAREIAIQHPEVGELLDLARYAEGTYRESQEVLEDLIRVYKATGQRITEEKFKKWKAEGWVPEQSGYMFIQKD